MPDEETFDEIFQPQLTRADVRSEVERTLRDISTFNYQAQAGVSAAIREVSSKHSDFDIQRPQMLNVLEQIPLLKDAVASAEGNPQLSATLPQMYETLYLAAKGSASAAGNATTAADSTASEPSKVETGRPSDLDENAMYAGALASQNISLTPENRKSILTDLEKRGILDIEF
jgi:hypothetical protein